MRTREAVNYHYDHPVEFWRLWLDESLCYSCAYFRSPGVTLAQAQQDKLDYVCRKLRLEPGMRLLDLGCGWGALVAHACRCYGVDAVGITLSPHQAKVAQARVEEAGLSRRCQIVTGDFLELDGLADDDGESDGLALLDGDRELDGDTDLDGDTEADGLSDLDTELDGDTEDDGLFDCEDDGLSDADGLFEND